MSYAVSNYSDLHCVPFTPPIQRDKEERSPIQSVPDIESISIRPDKIFHTNGFACSSSILQNISSPRTPIIQGNSKFNELYQVPSNTPKVSTTLFSPAAEQLVPKSSPAGCLRQVTHAGSTTPVRLADSKSPIIRISKPFHIVNEERPKRRFHPSRSKQPVQKLTREEKSQVKSFDLFSADSIFL